ncbi:MAG: hypothetical protein M3037_04300 [Gemmatimonadota bacterium]|nr:hypothetical protein [Gemmatimonadota bacterium]
MVDRESAVRIAEKEIVARGLGTGVRSVLGFDELKVRAPVLYRGPDLRKCWIAYAERPLRGLFASNIVLIDRESGEVLYSGSANDEG